MDFANLITKKISFLECINIENINTDWNKVDVIRSKGEDWLLSNRIKAFYTTSWSSSFGEGARNALENSGLGKLRPNLALIGFKENWNESADEAKGYFKTLQYSFEVHLSVAILRIQGGFDISNKALSSSLSTISTQDSSQCEDVRDDLPQSHQSNINLEGPEAEIQGKFKAVFSSRKVSLPETPSGQQVLFNSKGEQVYDPNTVEVMTQFRTEKKFKGFLDVYWLYDDGGLTLLIPHILSTRKKFSKCLLRIFILATDSEAIEEETSLMADLLAKFRIEYHQIITMTEITKPPGKKICDDFGQLYIRFAQKNGKDEYQRNLDWIENNSERNNFYLRIAEIVQENSKDSSMVIMTMPVPSKDDSLPIGLFFVMVRHHNKPDATISSHQRKSEICSYILFMKVGL